MILYILGALVLFFFAIDLLVSSLQHLGRSVAETILIATANPFNGLFMGLLITAMLQSSSTTTSLVVALVASGAVTLESAIPIIMGANVGTTITSTIVSLGFINKRKEFRRAVAAGTYHDFFNILTVIVLFPLEYYYGFLSSVSAWLAAQVYSPGSTAAPSVSTHSWPGFDPIIAWLHQVVPSAFVLAVVALVMLFGSIVIFRKLISNLLKAKTPEAFGRFFFKNQLKSFSWGLLTTAAIRSSTITTSVVVPLVAKKVVNLKQAAPFIMGANVGTTITAFIAAMLNANTSSALSIAIAHFLFNFIGVMLFFPIPVLRRLPMELASSLGKLTLRYRLVGFVYLLGTFFFIPFSLIYLNQDAVRSLRLTYEDHSGAQVQYYRIVTQLNTRTHQGEWSRYAGREASADEVPQLLYPVYEKNNTFFIGSQMVLFNRPGFCWDGEEGGVKYNACVEKIVDNQIWGQQTFDSVYVYRVQRHAADSAVHRYYFSAPHKILLQHERTARDTTTVVEKLIGFEEN